MPKAPAQPAGTTPWWQRAVLAFASDARRWLRLKFPALQHQHDDLVAETVAQLTRQLMVPAADAPPGWFGTGEPVQDDVRRFHGLAYTVLSRRVTDLFRHDTDAWMQRLDDTPSWQLPDDGAPDALSRLAQMRAARALLQAVLALSLRDRLLVEQVLLGDAPSPMSGADRERLRALRARLRRQLEPLLEDLSPPAAPSARPPGAGSDDA